MGSGDGNLQISKKILNKTLTKIFHPLHPLILSICYKNLAEFFSLFKTLFCCSSSKAFEGENSKHANLLSRIYINIIVYALIVQFSMLCSLERTDFVMIHGFNITSEISYIIDKQTSIDRLKILLNCVRYLFINLWVVPDYGKNNNFNI